jgi:MarR family 2-MHQ and catechol resistance regulon transcriptional repressor
MDVDTKAKELAGYLRTLKERIHRTDKWNPRTSAVLNVQEAHALLSIGTGGRMAMSEIAGRLQLSLSSMTAVIDKLEKKKFVLRGRQKEDRRVVEVRLTRAGRKFYDFVEEAHVRFTASFLETLSAGEQDMLLKLFRKITANLK